MVTLVAVPADLPKRAFEAGFLGAGVLNANQYFPAGTLWIGNVPVEKWTPFHTLVVLDELCRCGSAGFIWNLTGGLSIGIPPVLHYGSDALKAKVMPCLRGEKRICLAITEATAGSDLSQMKCSAKRTADGKFFVLNGSKKWITVSTNRSCQDVA